MHCRCKEYATYKRAQHADGRKKEIQLRPLDALFACSRQGMVDRQQLATPQASSSTGHLPSSPIVHAHKSGFVANVDINGAWLIVGRSSLLSDLVLPSSNNLISRVHAKIRFLRVSASFEVHCLGFNGLNLRIAKQCMTLSRDASILISTDGEEDLELDIMGCVVSVSVPREVIGGILLPSSPVLSQVSLSEIHALSSLPSPLGVLTPGVTPKKENLSRKLFEKSDLERGKENIPPDSPLPLHNPLDQIIEADTSFLDKVEVLQSNASPSFTEVEEANTPIQKMEESEPPTSPQKTESEGQENLEFIDLILSTLASSIISPAPLSQLTPFFPSGKPHAEIEEILRSITCVAEVPRIGKDASGKSLASTWYYEPALDTDSLRKGRLSALMKPVRTTRKRHVQYYWKPVTLKHITASGLLPMRKKIRKRT